MHGHLNVIQIYHDARSPESYTNLSRCTVTWTLYKFITMHGHLNVIQIYHDAQSPERYTNLSRCTVTWTLYTFITMHGHLNAKYFNIDLSFKSVLTVIKPL